MIKSFRILPVAFSCVVVVATAADKAPKFEPQSFISVSSVKGLPLPKEHCAGDSSSIQFIEKCKSRPNQYKVVAYATYDDNHQVDKCYTLILYESLYVHLGSSAQAITRVTWKLIDVSPLAFESVAFSSPMSFQNSADGKPWQSVIAGSGFLGTQGNLAYADIQLSDAKSAGVVFPHGATINATTWSGVTLQCTPIDPGIIVNSD